jgi:uncharacterized protein
MTGQPSHFIWYELMTDNVDAATAFYGTVIGWNVADSGMPGMDYRILSMAATPLGGTMAIPPPAAEMGMKPCWFGYLNVDDVDASIERIVASGGAVWMPPRDIPEVGRIAMVTDPQGAAIYVMAPTGTGTSRAFESGTPGHVGWNELHAKDGAAALAFYSGEFGWKQTGGMDMGPWAPTTCSALPTATWAA